jgi:hypothetical protein
MRLQHEGKQYKVFWRYDRQYPFTFGEFQGVPEDVAPFTVRTTCVVLDITDEQQPVPVAEGFAIKSLGDQHCRDTARKTTLSRALLGKDPAVRKAIWDAYINRAKQEVKA